VERPQIVLLVTNALGVVLLRLRSVHFLHRATIVELLFVMHVCALNSDSVKAVQNFIVGRIDLFHAAVYAIRNTVKDVRMHNMD